MAANSKIAWTTATFNPWIGCSKVHDGCTKCYAEAFAKRTNKAKWGANGTRVKTSDDNWKKTLAWDLWAANGICHKCEGRGRIKAAIQSQSIVGKQTDPCAACGGAGKLAPYRARVFCASLADVFEDWKGPVVNHKGEELYTCPVCGFADDDVQDGAGHWEQGTSQTHDEQPGWSDWTLACNRCSAINDMRLSTMADVRAELFRLIDATPNLDWLLLTKRPENIPRMWPANQDSINSFHNYHRSNVHLGTSISNQETADKMVPALLKCRELCPVLFLSAEPLLGPIDLTQWLWSNYDRAAMDNWLLTPLPGTEEAKLFHAKVNQVIFGVESSGTRVGRLGEFANDAAFSEAVADMLLDCRDAGVAAFVKQMPLNGRVSHEPEEWLEAFRVRQFPSVPLAH